MTNYAHAMERCYTILSKRHCAYNLAIPAPVFENHSFSEVPPLVCHCLLRLAHHLYTTKCHQFVGCSEGKDLKSNLLRATSKR